MLDPISALNVAAAVVQFVEFSSTLLKTARRINKSTDTIAEISELHQMVAELQRLSTHISSLVSTTSTAHASTPSLNNQKLGLVDGKFAQDLSQDCTDLADKVQKILRDLEISGDQGFLKSLKAAHKIERRKSELAGLQRHLHTIRSGVQTELLGAFSEHRSVLGQRLDCLENRQALADEAHDRLTAKLRHIHDNVYTALIGNSEDLSKQLTGYLVEARRVESAKLLLSSLRFEMMRAREQAIFDSHQGTFEWMLQSPSWTEQYKGIRVSFSDWLCNCGGIFWVSGKAGSGKSTLMKLIAVSRFSQKRVFKVN